MFAINTFKYQVASNQINYDHYNVLYKRPTVHMFAITMTKHNQDMGDSLFFFALPLFVNYVIRI